MEKLQVAIEKARSQRQRTSPPVALKKAPERTTTLWEQLTPVSVSPRILERNRLVASTSGADSGPFDMLRTRILQQARANSWKRVALVSPHSGCGKSTTAANLAFSFERQSDLRTMILDLDLRRVGLAKILEQDCVRTMGDVLTGSVAFADHGRRLSDNVALGLNSSPVGNPAEILQSGATVEVLNAIEADFKPDIMIFDMPPLAAADDNFGFLKNTDCALLVVAAEQTSLDQIDVAERQLAELTNVMGIVLNKCLYSEGAYGYGYG
ncbi:CpsD/CapB family tyrosine-protein kinase [Ruegeria arenilitoris]|uniref:CpsD/CapB family tyrosine-protein kinase n=1 Tax=Ruegeria arenilitoris TaxID=1173585 RepID=UPI0014802EBB|nr:CpsD/CapB family tyrosine-protein kinase [Ruegeria arenilitoris]